MGSRNKYVTELSEQKIAQLNDLIDSDWSAGTRKRAQAILLSNRIGLTQYFQASAEHHGFLL